MCVGTLLSVVIFYHFRCFLFANNQPLLPMSSRAELVVLSPPRRKYKDQKNARSPSVSNRGTPAEKQNALNFSVDYESPESGSGSDSDSELSDISRSSEVVYLSPKRKGKTTPSPGSPSVSSPPKHRKSSLLGLVMYSDTESDDAGDDTSFTLDEVDDLDQEIIGDSAGISPEWT